MKKRRAVLISALVLLAALAAWGTWAYFTAEARVTNVITTGTIRITLNDTMEGAVVNTDEDGSKTATLTGVMPGQQVSKTVSVTNSGTGEAWIRVRVTTTVAKAEKAPADDTAFTGPAVQLSFDTTGWIAETDTSGETGYYYYKAPVAAGGTTKNLFDSVMLNKLLPNSYQGCTVNIAVTAQAVQVKNNNAGLQELTATTLGQIKGWPAD